MNLELYSDYFHDGSIMEIVHTGDAMVIAMESAEMDEEDIRDDLVLAKDDRIRGRLHIEGIKGIKENEKACVTTLKMRHEDAEIFHFTPTQTGVEFQIIWNSYPPSLTMKNFSTIVIEATHIYWENVPEMSC